MSAPRQGDLFGHDGQDPSDEDFETPVYYPDPNKVREELHKFWPRRGQRTRCLGTPNAPRSIAPSSRK